MNKKFDIIKISKQNGDAVKPLTIEDYLSSISDNRNRIRLSASQLISISGMLLSANFIIVFFLIKENYSGLLIKLIYTLMFGSIFFLILTMIFIILSTIIPKPTSAANIGDKLNQQITIFNKEYKRLKISQYSFMVSIIILSIGLMLFIFKLN